MTADLVGVHGEPLWPSGVGGAQCDHCQQTTIVRSVDRDYLGEPRGWMCRACYEGWDEADD